MDSALREVVSLVLAVAVLTGVGAAYIHSRRHALRPRHLIVPGLAIPLVVALALPMLHDLRLKTGGESAAWGRMGEFLVLLLLAPVLCVMTGALVAALVVAWRIGFADPARRHAPPRPVWFTLVVRPRTTAEREWRHRVNVWLLFVALGALGVVWLRSFRPHA